MAYNPNMYMPYQYTPTVPVSMQQQQPVNGIVYVDGMEAVNGYQIPPNSVSPPLMLKSDNVFCIKETDGSGGATVSAYRFEEIPLSSLSASGDYVTKADFDAFAAKVMEAINGKHAVPEDPAPQA